MKYADGIGKVKQIKFGGMNHSPGAGDGELWEMRNLTSDCYPLLASRRQRMKYKQLTRGGGIFSWGEKLCWVDGTGFYCEGKLKGQVNEGEKTFAAMGAYIIILPDKVCYNVDTEEFCPIEARWQGEQLTFRDGISFGEDAKANTIFCEGVTWKDFFRPGDALTISGCTKEPGNNKCIIVREIEEDQLRFYQDSFTIPEGVEAYTEAGELKIQRNMPDVRYLCEQDNRMWGCGKDTVYACKQGDIFNWDVMDGLADDAYVVDTITSGDFTGCIAYRGYPTVFKEEHIYKVYGSVPSDFEVLGSASLGLAEGSSKSLAVAGETLFYLGRNGIMAYTGGIPQPMGAPFGLRRFRNAVGGSDGLKYYVSMEDTEGNWGLYVYDTQRGLWHQEDETRVTHFTRHEGNLYYLNDKGEIWITGNIQNAPEGCEPEGAVEWVAEFTDFTEDEPNHKGVSKLQLRLELDAGAKAQVWLQFDSSGMWQKVGQMLCEKTKRSYCLPIVPRRADHFRLKITGCGGCRISSIAREYYKGSEMRGRY